MFGSPIMGVRVSLVGCDALSVASPSEGVLQSVDTVSCGTGIASGVNETGPPLSVNFMAIAFAIEQLFQ